MYPRAHPLAQLIDKVRNTIEMTFGERFEQRLREAGKGTLLPGPFSSLLKKMQMGNAAASASCSLFPGAKPARRRVSPPSFLELVRY